MNRVVTFALIYLIHVMVVSNLYAQDHDTVEGKSNRYSISIFAGEHSYDVGAGFEIGSPAFFNKTFCIRLKGSVNWFEQYNRDFDHWATYRIFGGSLVYNYLNVDRGRLYLEAGTFFILPDNRISDQNHIRGISVLTGAELFIANNNSLTLCYYFTGGIDSVNATADKLDKDPRYGSGIVFYTGFRMYF